VREQDRTFAGVLHELEERAKELGCLHRVEEILRRPGLTTAQALQLVVEVLPRGWQFPEVCQATLEVQGTVYRTAAPTPTVACLTSRVFSAEQQVGQLQVCYTQPVPVFDEGPFIEEERQLVDTVADRIGQYLQHQELRAALEQRSQTPPPEGRRHAWWAILELLQRTDRGLVRRLSRKMTNHLLCLGVSEARDLLGQLAGRTSTSEVDVLEANQPIQRQALGERPVIERIFRQAALQLSEDEILALLQQWIQEDKLNYLLEVVEGSHSSLVELAASVERYQRSGVDASSLSPATQSSIRVSLVRRLFSDDIGFMSTARHFLGLDDFHELLQRVILLPESRGKLGGKSSGLVLAHAIVRKSPETQQLLGTVKIPKTWYLPSDALLGFIHHNDLEDVYNWKYLEIEQIRQGYPHIVQAFKESRFPPEMVDAFSLALDDFAGRPLIVRSSSLLEDRQGSAFSGKYKSLFLANQGSKEACLEALMDAVAEVYASIFGPDPIEYRAERGLLDTYEEMGVMIQEVVGTRVGKYFLPAFAGVAFSNNEFRWSPRIQRQDGLLRLVLGLGTRAVDRVGDDFPVLLTPGQPGLRVNVTADEALRYSQRRIDLIDLERGTFETVPLADFLRQHGDELPLVDRLLSVVDDDVVRPPPPLGIDFAAQPVCVTFDGLVAKTPFMAQIKALLGLLRDQLGTPVDLEFAHDGRDFFLLQCRPQSNVEDCAPAPIPRDVPPERTVFSARRYVSNGRVPDITHIVYVDPARYDRLERLSTLRRVGRAVGRCNKLLPRRRFILMGPSRWGSRGDIKLGVNVTYSDINNTALLIEIARKKGNYVPDLSFGTHFFQDLVEAAIRYLPLFPDEGDVVFNQSFLLDSPSILPTLAPEFADLADVVRVIDVPQVAGGQVLRVAMNAEQDEALAYLGQAEVGDFVIGARPLGAAPVVRSSTEDHWQWRQRMVQQLAARLEPARFGVVAAYLFGSTKNATAGPGSDINLLLHVRNTPAQQELLAAWLAGWSQALAEVNYLRTGHASEGLLDVHYLTDEDLARQTGFAAQLGSRADAVRPLPLARDEPAASGPEGCPA